MNATHPSPEISFLSFPTNGYLLESEEFLSFYRNPVVHHSLFSLSITIGSGTDLLSSSDADNDKILRG